MLHSAVGQILTDVSEELTASITRAMSVMETVSSSETSVNIYQISRRNIPEDSHLQDRCLFRGIRQNELRTGWCTQRPTEIHVH
jgi:hypothetical protein